MTGGLERSDLARMRRMGVLPMATEDGLRLLDTAEQSTDSLVVAARFDPRTLAKGGAEGALRPPARDDRARTSVSLRRRTVASVTSVEGGAEPGGPALRARLAGLGDAERHQLVLRTVREHAATVLGYDAATAIPVERGFLDLGIDSLTAVELRNRLKTETGLPLPATLVFDHPDATRLARYLDQELPPAVAGGTPVDGDADRDAEPGRRAHARSAPETASAAKAPGVAGRLESADADELFDFIDREFGPN
ncbi:phosphopantetheine-binding protein, partial [Streptomyces sp. NRRL F-5630]|uniref:acyl carrier protein n=1 Tax=Streptomyces sp. NRRL F-5630 TaxID=1463864 RepID=UPI003D74C9E1